MNMNKLIKQESWYQELLVDLKKLEFTGIVLTKWNIGKRILADFEKFGKPEYGNKRVENIAKDLGGSSSDLWHCLKFAKKYPKTLTPLENLSWRKVVNKFLYEKQDQRRLLSSPNPPKGKYNIIYADPPWTFYAGGYKNQSQYYDTMSIEEICRLPVQELAAENCPKNLKPI